MTQRLIRNAILAIWSCLDFEHLIIYVINERKMIHKFVNAIYFNESAPFYVHPYMTANFVYCKNIALLVVLIILLYIVYSNETHPSNNFIIMKISKRGYSGANM